MQRVIREENIRVGVLAVSREYASEITTLMVNYGIVGILHFISAILQVPTYVVVENFDINTKLEKIGYYIRFRANTRITKKKVLESGQH